MFAELEDRTLNSPRVLMFSVRNIYYDRVFMSQTFEFEDIVRQIDSVAQVAPPRKKHFALRKRIALRIGKNFNIPLNPGTPRIIIDKHYDLFFAVCQFPSELLMVNAVKGWKENCNTSICFLSEIWLKDMHDYKSSLKVLSDFDYVLTNCSQSVRRINEVIRGKCLYFPPGIDAILFCPYPEPPQRVIDVLSIGRRSEKTHKALLRMVKENKMFYTYDTINDYHVFNTEEHRQLLANKAKRSWYFIVNPGKIDNHDETGTQSEFGFRYFEGAASGAIMIGEYPKNEEFKKIFSWPDAVVHVPYDSESVKQIINEMDQQHDRQEQVRRNNVVQSLLQHDWVYRWETILTLAGLQPMPELFERKKRLKELSSIVE